MESISSGFVAGINLANEILGKSEFTLPKETVMGALADYVSTKKENFQPMNANFGILPQLEEKIRDKKIKYGKLADISLEKINEIKKDIL